jgi:hypothetical protein
LVEDLKKQISTGLSKGLRFNSKNLFVLMVVVTFTIIVDSEIGVVADFIPSQISSSSGIAVFILIAIIFVLGQYFILAYIKQTNENTREGVLHLKITHRLVSLSQYVLAGIVAVVILQILLLQQYDLASLYVSYSLSYGLWIAAMGLLAKALYEWYRFSSKSIMVLILALSMSAYVINGIAGMATHFDMLNQQKTVVTSIDIAFFPEFSIATLANQINIIYQVSSGVAYVLTWIGTVRLLYPYTRKLGRFKFWTLMCAVMVYYLVSFPLFVLGYFTLSENADAMTNIIIFSLGGIFTGVVFGAAFLSVARTLKKESVLRNHMIIAAYGFLLFYIAGSAYASQAAYPPFGLVSVSLTGLSCYLIYSGLYSSAVTVSQDITLRTSIRRSVTEQSKLLDSIGTAQMDQELQSRVMMVTMNLSYKLEEETGVEASMTEEDIKEHIEMVRKEIKK